MAGDRAVYVPNKMAQVVILLTCIRGVPGLNHDRNAAYPCWFFVVPLRPCNEILRWYLILGHDRAFHENITPSFVTHVSTIRCSIDRIIS